MAPSEEQSRRVEPDATPQERPKEQHVSHQDNDETSDKVTAETTAAFRADFLGELDASAAAEAGMRGIEGLPSGSAVLVVKRGPNAGSRFLLDRPVASAGRHPDSDIFLDDVTASRCHAEFRRENGTFRIVDLGQPQRHLCQPSTGGLGGAGQRG